MKLRGLRARRSLTAIVCVVSLIAGVVLLWAHETGRFDRVASTVSSVAATDKLSEGLGLYASTVLRSDGSINVDRTIAKLRAEGATRYYYLIWDRRHPGVGSTTPVDTISRGEWGQLPEFADKADAVGIDVVVYLVPPLESTPTTYLPFGWDYVAWFREVGAIAAAHRNIVGVAIDDFGAATDTRTTSRGMPAFTPGLVRQMVAEARVTAPWLKFYAVLYAQDFVGATATLPPFRGVVDGVIYAFAGPNQVAHAAQNTTDPRGADFTGELVRRVTSCQGRASCWQLSFPAPRRVAMGATATLRRSVELPEGGVDLQLDFTDNRVPGDSSGYTVRATVDGHDVTVVRSAAGSWQRLSAHLPATTSRRAVLSITVSRSVYRRKMSVTLSNAQLRTASGRVHLDPTTAGWLTSTSGGATVDRVQPLKVVFMIYAARFGSEVSIPGAADRTYVGKVSQQVQRLADNHDIDGVVIYRLNLSGARTMPGQGDPASAPLVRDLYRELSTESSAHSRSGQHRRSIRPATSWRGG
ncbi:hypothetical protein N5P18_01890 [Janibacter terrae]|uniref:Uncharacterized protein n=1 Tax=Janibacter terrae TaxID=103817 RepID=A0ABZ2FE93_9MICO